LVVRRKVFWGGNEMDQMDHSRHGLIREEESVLVVIEMQEKLFPAMAEKEKLLDNVMRLVRFARILNLPVVVTEMEKLGNTLPQVMSELKGVQPVVRSDFNCFGSQVFSSRIKELERGVLILAGIEAHICIAQTALHAVPAYRVHVVSDAISSRSSENRKVALERMAQGGVTVSSTEMVIYELLKNSGREAFKQALKLVK
jgi:isochorismate hydrolase